MNTHASIPVATPPLQAEAFAHVDHWIFDLDNTLYSHEARVWPQVDDRITAFIAELSGSTACRRAPCENTSTTATARP